MNLYFYIRTWFCVSCGYKKKNTWQRARAVRQVQSFHSKHICVCWASVALGRQARQAATACLQSLRLPSTERWLSDSCRLQLDHMGGRIWEKGHAGILPSLSPRWPYACKVQVHFLLGGWLQKQPGDSATAKLRFGVEFFCLWFLFFIFSNPCPGVYCLESCSLGWFNACSNRYPCRNISADLQSSPFTASV